MTIRIQPKTISWAEATNYTLGKMAYNLIAALEAEAAIPKLKVKLADMDEAKCSVEGCDNMRNKTANGKHSLRCTSCTQAFDAIYRATAKLKAAQHKIGAQG